MPCIVCQRKVFGRTDKKFCSVHCKNEYHAVKRKMLLRATKEVSDRLLQNRNVLEQMLDEDEFAIVEDVDLRVAGFRFDSITGYRYNEKDQVEHQVFDFYWRRISHLNIFVSRADTDLRNLAAESELQTYRPES